MFIRQTKVTRGEKIYKYAQLVQSVRRASDGLPTHKVIANLGQLSEEEVANLKAAMAASRAGKRVIVAPNSRRRTAAPKPCASLRYLDLAVLLELWREWGLDEAMESLMPQGQRSLSPALIVTALVLQRCVAPGSKLHCTRWLPRTALSELLDIDPALFNNTRVHRVLEQLEEVEPQLQRVLPRRYRQQDGAFATLFLDLSDAWFVGHGPELAQYGKTKEGLLHRKIGIVLLCNEKGYPLRWEVVSGKKADNDAMGDMFRAVAGKRWAQDVPIVCDRAMGTTDGIRTMLQTKRQFITLLRSNEFLAYCPELPWQDVDGIELAANASDDVLAEKVAKRIQEQARMSQLSEHFFAMDFGIVERAGASPAKPRPETPVTPENPDDQDHIVRAMQLCRAVTEAVLDKQYGSYQAAGRALGLTTGNVKKYRLLHKLAQDIQHEILAGRARGRSLTELIRLTRIKDRQEQRARFEALLQSPKRRMTISKPGVAKSQKRLAPVRVRAVAFFDAKSFVAQRRKAAQTLKRIRTFIDELNRSLAKPGTKRTRDSVATGVDRELRSLGLLSAFMVTIDEVESDSGKHFRVAAELKVTEWQRRRCTDGFSILIAAPHVSMNASQLDQCYRAKDIVEKDFGVIKSVLQVRPVRHRTDDKVRAHVTLCMLALLLERTLKQKLNGKYTSAAALEILASCNLTKYREDQQPPVYVITQPDPSQQSILRILGLQDLSNDETLAETITPQ